MKRQDKYPETSTFHYFNANPKNRITGDCTIRAICTALEIPYNQVVMEMAELQCKTGYCDKKGIEKYLSIKGWVKHSQPRKSDNTKYTGKEFCEIARNYENYIAMIGGHHIVAIINAKIYDIWDSTDGCIGNYWTKG
ncbi:MAG: hypothetical protein ACI4XP_03185 [Acutalibacteraceae bacterium]